MIKLIGNEFYKLFHKKSTYIFLAILFAFIIFVNVIYKYFDSVSSVSTYTTEVNYDEEIADNQKNITTLDKNSSTYWQDYAYYMAQIDVDGLLKNYTNDSSQISLIHNEYEPLATEYYNALYVSKDNSLANQYLNKMNKIKEYLNNENWQEYVKDQIKNNNLIIDNDQEKLKTLTIEAEKDKINKEIELYTYYNKLLQYRLDNNVSYETGYLNTALTQLTTQKEQVLSYEGKDNLSTDEKNSYNNAKNQLLTNEYIINNKVDINNTQSLKTVLQGFFDEYEFFLVTFIIMVAGAIVSDEFNKGTIKSLLIVPFKRSQILGAKFITVLLMVPIISLITLIFELIVGGVMFGFGSLNVPVLAYNYSTGNMMFYNIFHYLLIMFGINSLYIIMLGLISFVLSVLITNTAFSIAASFCLIVVADIINNLVMIKDIKVLKYLLTLNWNFSQYAFGAIPAFKYINLKFSIIVYLAYFIILLLIAFIVFKKRDIKNI